MKRCAKLKFIWEPENSVEEAWRGQIGYEKFLERFTEKFYSSEIPRDRDEREERRKIKNQVLNKLSCP